MQQAGLLQVGSSSRSSCSVTTTSHFWLVVCVCLHLQAADGQHSSSSELGSAAAADQQARTPDECDAPGKGHFKDTSGEVAPQQLPARLFCEACVCVLCWAMSLTP